MKIIIVPPIRLDEINGSRTRTVEVYSRLGPDFDVTFAVDISSEGKAERHYTERLNGSTSAHAYAGSNPLRLLVSVFRLALRARRTDAVVCYDEFGPSVSFSYLISRLSRRPLVIVVHHVEDGLRKRGFLMERGFRYCSGIFALDNELVLEETRQMFPGKNILPVTNGVDTAHYASVNQATARKGCLYVGVLSERKGKRLLLEIWRQVRSGPDDSGLRILAGITPGREIDDFLASAASMGIGDSISVEGYVDEKTKIDAYSSSSVFIFPSLYEGFGLSIVEALASGTPAVIWDLPSFSRFREGVVKIRYPDTEAFGREVLRLLSDEGERKSLGLMGRRFVEEHLSWELAAAREREALLRLLSQRSAPTEA